jgi:hypothetical protein
MEKTEEELKEDAENTEEKDSSHYFPNVFLDIST